MQFILFNNMKSAILSSAKATVKENMFWLLCCEILHTHVILEYWMKLESGFERQETSRR